jgi:ABC-type transport system substrate-binding protein
VGCSSGDNSGSPAAERTSVAPDQPDILNPAAPAKYGGRLVTANAASFGAWDPHKGIAVASAYFPRIYNVLLSQSASKPEFVFRDLAASYEIPDNNTFVFSIRPGVHIAPNKIGVPERDLDGEDVRTTFERLRSDPATNAYNFAHGHIARVEVDGDTVRIITTEP